MSVGLSLELKDRQKPYLIAHRGNKVACPENTAAAFQQALEDGADILETDLHVSADGHFICIHDSTLDRTTDGSGSVSKLSLDQIKSVSASCSRPAFESERVPTLAELIEILPPDIGLALELKSDSFLEEDVCQKLVAILRRSSVDARTVLLSFSIDRLRSIRSVEPELPIGWITLRRAWPISEVEMIGPLWPWLFVNPLYVAIAHSKNQLVCPLDPTPDRRLAYYQFLRCDAVLSDDPGATARSLGR
jgi:glycerophosphoryl diester phosphodiesterase